jgi:N-acetylmuramoyl-L-alanine amidase
MLRERLTFALILCSLSVAIQGQTTLENIRIGSNQDQTRLVLDLSNKEIYNSFFLRNPNRLVVDLKNTHLSQSLQKKSLSKGLIRNVRTGIRPNKGLRVVLDIEDISKSKVFLTNKDNQVGHSLVIDLFKNNITQTKNSYADKNEVEVPRYITIVIDPGHGGHDPGAIGRNKIKEKDVALSVGRHLFSRINRERGMRAILVRNNDKYVNHRDRMEVARQNNADLFISIHADAVNDRRAKGASVYAVSLKGASDEAAKRLERRENASDLVGGISLSDKDDDLASVLMDLSKNGVISVSLDIGQRVLKQLAKVGAIHRSKTQQAGFLVLKSPDIPSILVEMAYISNPNEEKKLNSKNYQLKLTKAMHSGIKDYFYQNPPRGTLIAQDIMFPNRELKHVIIRGDTLSEIAQYYNVSMPAIRSINKMKNNNIRIGQVLKIPSSYGT